MKRYLKHIKKYWGYFILAPMFMLLEVYCDVQIPTLASRIINEGILQNDNTAVYKITLQMILTLLSAVLFGIGCSYCATKASVNFSHDLREEIFTKIQAFSFKNIDKFSTGSLVTRLTNDITQVGQLVVMCLRMMFRAPGMLVGSIIMAYRISPALCNIFFALAPVLVIIIVTILKLAYPKFALLQEKIDALNTNVQEGLINIRVIKSFTRESYEQEKFQKVNEDLRDTGLSAYRINQLQSPLMTLSVNIATLAILWFGSQLLSIEVIEIGDISALITYLSQIIMSVNMIANVFMQSSRSLVSAKRLSEILDEVVDITDMENTHSNKTVNSGDIVFENVSFKYYENSQENVLTNLNFSIKSGQTVGIVGSTGCGKTSLVNLISRLYEADSGRILVDGVDVKDYSLKNLRDGVGMVLQQNLLFSGSIKDNLQWGREDATQQEIEQMADFSASKQFIEETSQQYDTLINQGGLNLSGGQKQRLCIARALIKKSKILILDDSTSAVDTATEQKIRQHLQNDLKEMTKLIIAQRISSVEHADLILVLDEGEISAKGTHKELLENSEVYQQIYRSQVDNGDITEVS